MRRNGERARPGRRRSRRAPEALGAGTEASSPAPAWPGGTPGIRSADVGAGGAIAGYRLIRRMATGERTTVYLGTPEASAGAPRAAVADAAESAFAPPPATAGDAHDAAAGASGPVALRLYGPDADPGAITVELEALAADGGRTLPAPYDLASFADGRVCIVVERIGGERLSKILAERSLRAGEAVTVLAPLAAAVRRLAEAGFVHTRLAASDVLFDATGRPRLLGLGALVRLEGLSAVERSAVLREGHAALGRLVGEVASAVRPPSTFARATDLVAAGLEARPFVPFALELERELFEIAAAEPVLDPMRVGATAARPSISPPPVARSREATGEVHDDDHGVRRERSARAHLGADQAPDATQVLLEGESPVLAVLRWSRLRAAGAAALARRRAPLLVGALGGGAALVVLLALVPPAGAPDRAAAWGSEDAALSGDGAAGDPGENRPGASTPADTADDAGSAAERGSETGEPSSETAQPPGVEPDPAVAAAELLELRDSCLAAADRECLAAVVQPGSALEAEDLAALALEPADRAERVRYDLSAVSVQGTMGQAVLLQVPVQDAERQPASLLMVRSEAGWRLRELFD